MRFPFEPGVLSATQNALGAICDEQAEPTGSLEPYQASPPEAIGLLPLGNRVFPYRGLRAFHSAFGALFSALLFVLYFVLVAGLSDRDLERGFDLRDALAKSPYAR